MFYNFPHDFKVFEPAPGFLVHVVSGQRLMFSHVTLQPNAVAPLHNHAEEQMGLVLEGEIEFTIGDETRLVKKGDMYSVPSSTNHGGTAGAAGCVALDVFCPPRETYK